MTERVADLERRLQRVLDDAAAQITVHPLDWEDREPSRAQRPRRWPPSLGTLAACALVAITLAITAGAMLLFAHRASVASAPPRPTVAAKPRPTFASEAALVGRVHRLRGTPIMILAWASWCGPCQPDLQRVLRAAAHYHHEVKFLLADTTDSRKRARRVLIRRGLRYPIYETQTKLQGIVPQPLRGLPTLIFINRQGKVSYVHPGEYLSVAAIEHDIEIHLSNG